MKASIILPTYNERDNIIKLVESVIHVVNKVTHAFEIIIIDDSSPDKTGIICKDFFKKNSKVKTYIRKKDKGFASAILYGIKKSKGEFVVVMDTDFSHDPRMLPIMLAKAINFDIVIGSRYVKNGGGENKVRYALSKAFNIYLHLLLGIGMKDFLFGYFCVNKKFLIKNNLLTDYIFSGFGDYFIRLAFFVKRYNGKFVEIPAFYKDRIYGSSKSNLLKMFFTYTRTSISLCLLDKPKKEYKQSI